MSAVTKVRSRLPERCVEAVAVQQRLDMLVMRLRASRGFEHKRDISDVVRVLGDSLPGGTGDMAQAVAVGDDCAALPDGEGYLLFAIEGLVEDFIERMPWFAGYSAVMVNISDIYAMGGRPLAVVDALWSPGLQPGAEVLAGMAAASQRYGVPIVGGHSNNRSLRPQVAVAILGRARRLLTSFNARPGDALVMAVDLRGAYQDPFPFWNASTSAPAMRLRGDLELLSVLAEEGLCDAAKDISMAGALGTALMLLECSRVGAVVDLEALPRPSTVSLQDFGDEALLRWLTAFPSYGFVLSVRPEKVEAVVDCFQQRDLAAAVIGQVQTGSALDLQQGSVKSRLWDWAEQPFIAAPAGPKERS